MNANETIELLLDYLIQQQKLVRMCPRINAARRLSTLVQTCQRLSTYGALLDDIRVNDSTRKMGLMLLAPIWIAILRHIVNAHAGWPLEYTAKTIRAWQIEGKIYAEPVTDTDRAIKTLTHTIKVHPSDLSATFHAFFALQNRLDISGEQLNRQALETLGITTPSRLVPVRNRAWRNLSAQSAL